MYVFVDVADLYKYARALRTKTHNFYVNCSKVRLLNNVITSLDPNQFNSIINSDNRLLDLIFSNTNQSMVVNREAYPFVHEDPYHPALSITDLL